jgi:hypothetical protein
MELVRFTHLTKVERSRKPPVELKTLPDRHVEKTTLRLIATLLL